MVGMRFDFFNRPSIRMCLGFLGSCRPSSQVAVQTSDSPTSASLQILDVGILGTDASSSTGLSPFFALIIGIDEYASPEVRNLEGAVPDALSVKRYLEEDLGVMASQIRLLCNAEATRGAIIQEFNNLIADQRIHRGDPILIYYAGHGGEVDAPEGWEAGDVKIQMLIPHDFRSNVDGQGTYGIPDRTISTLLSHIAEKCGDNITLVFDCCHSGSTCADVSESTRIARVTEIPNDVPWDLDLEIWSDAQGENLDVTIAPGFLRRGLRSHILLAACGAKELAYEDQGKGIFTAALLNLLSTVGAHNVTYANLLQRLPSLTGQNPQCEGFHRNRALFNAKAQSRGRVLFKVQKEGNNYVMDAGTTRGIDVGDEFTLYRDPDTSRKSPPLGIFVVREAHQFHSTMAPLAGASRFKLHRPAFALQTKAGTKQDLRVYAAKRKKLMCTFEALVREMQRARPDRPRILRVEKENAELSIDLDGRKVVFDILDENVTVFNLRRIPFSVKPDVSILHPILDAAAHFHWHLRRTDIHNFQNKIRLEFTEVKQVEGKYDEDLRPVIEPVGNNLNQNGVIHLVASSRDMYGIKVFNDSSVSLYAALFYFDNSNLSITSLYQPPFPDRYKADPSLRANESIKLGYGSGGEAPFTYTLNEGQDLEVGFLKLFVSTDYVDFSDIPQLSPFTTVRSLGRADASFTNTLTWDAILVTVVLRKG